MAEFKMLGSTPTREVRGGNKLVKVREFHALSLPSETFFGFRRDATQPCYSDPKPCAQQFADRIEAVLALPDVVDVDYFEDTAASGRLRDMMRTFFETDDGAVSGSVEQELKNFGPTVTGAAVAQAIADERALL